MSGFSLSRLGAEGRMTACGSRTGAWSADSCMTVRKSELIGHAWWCNSDGCRAAEPSPPTSCVGRRSFERWGPSRSPRARPAHRAGPAPRRSPGAGHPQRLPPRLDRTPLIPGIRGSPAERRCRPCTRTPGHPRSVPELAAISGLSRAAFARTFRDALGQAPMQYLTDWRMALVRDHPRTGELAMTHIARTVGYSSPYAFAAGFRRHHGEPPGTGGNGSRSARRHAPGMTPTPTDIRPTPPRRQNRGVG
ncbi:helix-turn-helix transcriptional regulator [Streptomyces sp. NPDC088253]|uniref:helix-turn-helix transcriptional regulator n=1 Tax=Streptomyces sp. NPDC088253 TaxID=3365846 RepID=UPI0038021D59